MKKIKYIILSFFIITLISLMCIMIMTLKNKEIYIENVSLFINNKVCEPDNLIIKDNDFYIALDCLIENNLLDAYWDKNYNRISVFKDFEYHKITYNIYKAHYSSNSYELGDVLYISSDKLYLNLDFLHNNFINNIYTDKHSEKVIISDIVKQYKLIKDSNILYGTSLNDKKVLKENDIVYVYDYMYDNYILCKTDTGIIGFINCSSIIPLSTVKYKTFTKDRRNPQITLAWDLQNVQNNIFKEFEIPDVVDILAPTWYDLVNNKDFFLDISSDDYTKYVHSKNKQLWATFSNSFDKDLTNELLNNAYKRSRIIDRIIYITKEKGYDGINIDFENVYMKDRNVFSTFIKELYCKALKENITLSVDVAVMSNSETWSKFLDRKAVGQYSDYVILMAYDENVSGISGSVSSIPWVDYGVEDLLKSVSAEKIILAVPFYTRLWEESTTDGDVKSTSLKITTAKRIINELGIELTYDEKTGQNYGEKIVDGVLCRIWNEDETSLANRMNIIKKYNLAGKAVWAFDFGTDEMWQELK